MGDPLTINHRHVVGKGETITIPNPNHKTERPVGDPLIINQRHVVGKGETLEGVWARGNFTRGKG